MTGTGGAIVVCTPTTATVFVCAVGETAMYPCPVPPATGCHRAASSDVVCCKAAP